MKTKFFMNGLGAKLALAVVALVGGMFASCSQEDLSTTFKPAPAVIDFNVKVVDALTTNVITDATITGAETITAEAGYAGGQVTVTATKNGASASETVTVNPLKAGGKATYNVTLILSDDFDFVKVSETTTPSVAYSLPYAHGSSHAFDHSGSGWFENPTEFIADITVDYVNVDKAETTGFTLANWLSETQQEGLTVLFESKALNYDKSEAKKFEYQASAWSWSRAAATTTTVEALYNIVTKVSGEKAGEYTITTTSTAIEPEEKADPNHASHYVAHQGTHDAHGGHNYGGGIVTED